MSSFKKELVSLEKDFEEKNIHVFTLGGFKLWRSTRFVKNKEWGRDKTIQLFQFFISNRFRHGVHKEQIIDQLWETASDRDFKVALHGVNKILEPNRPSRQESKYIIRQGLSYHLNKNKIWIDVEQLEKYIALANRSSQENSQIAKKAYRKAIELYEGIYLPNRIYEDWSSEERERIQVLILGAYLSLAELTLKNKPLETIRLAQRAISIDPCWEDAYRIQMEAYLLRGNRPQAINTYRKCQDILNKEYGIQPLPDTQKIMKKIIQI